MKKLSTAFIAVILAIGMLPAPAWAYSFIGFGTGDFTESYLSARLTFQGGNDVTLLKGKSKTLKVTGNTNGVRWRTSNQKVAAVTQSGIVKAKKAGKATITATNASGFSVDCTVKVYSKRTQAQAKKAILALKAKYPEGKRWTNANHYNWEAAETSCYGCAAFAGIASDKAFGKYAPFKKHRNFDKVKVGDAIRIGTWHMVVVLQKKGNSVVVCEGNYRSSIHWGAVMTRGYFEREGYQVWTRYR